MSKDKSDKTIRINQEAKDIILSHGHGRETYSDIIIRVFKNYSRLSSTKRNGGKNSGK